MSKLRIVHKRKIKSIRELRRQVYISGFGKDAIFRDETMGFAAVLDPGFDLFFLGEINPGFAKGQVIKLILEGDAPNASPDSANASKPNEVTPDR